MTKHADAVVSAAPLRLWLDYEFAISSCLVVFTSTNIIISQQKLLVFCICLFLLNCALKTLWDRCRMAASSKDWNCICRRFVSIGGEGVTRAQYWRQWIINIYFVIANQIHSNHLPRKVTNERRFGISWYREIARRISLYSRVALPLAFLLSQGHHPKSYGGKMAKRFTTTTMSIIFRENISTGFCSSTKFLRNIRGIIHVQRFPRLRWSVCRPPPTSQWKVCFEVVCCY